MRPHKSKQQSAVDLARQDFLKTCLAGAGVCDHKGDAQDPAGYSWWRIQKAVDLYTIRGRFAPLYSYERSVRWPNGHRNVIFTLRCRPILDIPEAEQSGKQGAAARYGYLRRFSATAAGTDWRDSDPELEPIVEIYQGYGQDYGGSQEMPGAPRAGTEKESAVSRLAM